MPTLAYVLNVFKTDRGIILAGAATVASAALWALLGLVPDVAYRSWWLLTGFGLMGAWGGTVLGVVLVLVCAVRAVDRPAFLDARPFRVTMAWMAASAAAALLIGLIPMGGVLALFPLGAVLVAGVIGMAIVVQPDSAARRRRRIRHRALRVAGRLGRLRLLISLPVVVVVAVVATAQLTPIDRGVCVAYGSSFIGGVASIDTDCGSFRIPIESYDSVRSGPMHIITRGFDLTEPWSIVPIAVEVTAMYPLSDYPSEPR